MFKHEKTDQGLKLVDVLCNKCGKSCGVKVLNAVGKQLGVEFEYAEVMAFWGYESPKDTERHRSHLCEACYDSFVATFVLPPRVVEGGSFDPEVVSDEPAKPDSGDDATNQTDRS